MSGIKRVLEEIFELQQQGLEVENIEVAEKHLPEKYAKFVLMHTPDTWRQFVAEINQVNNAFQLESPPKYRLKSWWWGRYIVQDRFKWIDEKGSTFPKSQVPNDIESDPDWELYIESEHGSHHDK